MKTEEALLPGAAQAIYDVLQAEVGASNYWRENFVYTQTTGYCSEYRFQGSLGFGGKFWRTSGYRPDGTWGEVWRVNCYREDETPDRLTVVERANLKLEGLRARWGA